MKNIIVATLIIMILFSTWFLSSCGTKTGVFGQPVTEAITTRIGDILAHPAQFTAKAVKIEGKITEECPAGGWFMLKDESGIIYVDLHASYFAIPQAVGSRAVAQGIVKKEGTQVSITGKGVQIK